MSPDISPLRMALDAAIGEAAAAGAKVAMKDLTVLDKSIDPFRIDTPARHRDGQWLADTARELGLGTRKIHLRGLHYMLLGQSKPDGTPYANTKDDWLWLAGDAGKAARWLGYLPFDQITDQRNDAPTVRIFEPSRPWPYLHVGVNVDIPDVDDLEPQVMLLGFSGAQPYKLVMIGEKSSLDEVLSPVADRFGADLYLPTGEISDTLIYQMARVGADDGRPMRVLYFSDCDPAGWQMPISVGRKLQAFKALTFPDLEFQVHRVALTPDQVHEHELPSNPLKETELRGQRWREQMGVEQTEIDALAALRPDLLRSIARDAAGRFYDATLAQRVFRERERWLAAAQAAVEDAMDDQRLDRLRTEAGAKLAELRAEIEALNEEMRIDASDLDLPPVPPVPQAALNGGGRKPLLDSAWSFAEQTRRLKESKQYRAASNGEVTS